jgi:hypothetical protein
LDVLLSRLRKYLLKENIRSKEATVFIVSCKSFIALPDNTKTETRFEIKPININYHKPFLVASLIKCFPCASHLAMSPHQRIQRKEYKGKDLVIENDLAVPVKEYFEKENKLLT